MLVDTGATATAIALDAARELGLQQTGIRRSYGVSGLHTSPLFSALLTLTIKDGGATTTLTLVREAIGVPDLSEPYRAIDARDGQGKQVRLIGLLGRDFLQHVTMTYRGSKAEVEFVLDMKSLQPAKKSP